MDRKGWVLRLINCLSLGWICESLVQYFSLGIELHSGDPNVVLGGSVNFCMRAKYVCL